MPHFEVVASPVFSPTRCVSCHANRDVNGFVDLLVEDATLGHDEHGDPIHDPDGLVPTIGHLYLCLTCLYQAAKPAGCLDPQGKADLVARLAAAEAQTAALQADLEAERANKVVSLDTVRELLKPKAKAGAA